MTNEELKTVVINHSKWLLNSCTGKQAMLQNTDLSNVDLQGVSLKKAELRKAIFTHANLPGIDLSSADITGADFSHAMLENANLSCVYALDANFHGAKLCYVNFQGASLRGADLSHSNLYCANLFEASMEDANITGATLPNFQIPQHGELRVYKKVQRRIVHLLIPAWAKRTGCLVNRKCRASAAIVLAIEGDKPVRSKPGSSTRTTYEVGKTIYPDSYDPDPRVDCTHGIHFFLTREEAKKWVG